MAKLFLVYLILGSIGLSFWHSYQVIRKSREPGAVVNAVIAGKRERRVLIASIVIALAFAVAVFLLSLVWPEIRIAIVFTPFLYLVLWSVPRLFSRET